MTDTDHIRACIVHCASRRDGRGRWRAERACAEELAALRAIPSGRIDVWNVAEWLAEPNKIELATAAAARALGAWMARRWANA